MKYILYLFFYVCLTCGFFATNTFANVKPLPIDQAFSTQVTFNNSALITAEFNIAPGYYLYSQKVHVIFDPVVSANIRYPEGEIKYDAHRGNYAIYSGNLVIPVSLNTNLKPLKMTLEYQGCSEHGFCYPPMQKNYQINFATQTITPMLENSQTNVATPSIKTLLTDQNRVNALLASQHLGMMLLIFLGLGLLLAFTPCVLPMIPILTSIIVGQKHLVNTKKALLLSIIYVLGSAITYAFAGVIAALMGSSLQAYLEKPWIIAIVAAIFFLLALSLFGVYDLHIPRRWQSNITAISRKQKGGTYIGAFIMGMVSSLIVSPCVTAPLVGVLMYVAKTGDMVLGASALFALGIGMGIPLIAIGTSAGKWLPRRGPWMIFIQKIFGVLMVVMAVWLLTRIPILNNVAVAQNAKPDSFITVHSVDELNKQLELAQAAHKPVLLDFYADWCASCVAMEHDVFDTATVKKELAPFILIRADLSNNNSADEILLKNYSVVAPPTVLFFNNQGHEMNSQRIVGEVNANEFIQRLNTFFTASCDTKMEC